MAKRIVNKAERNAERYDAKETATSAKTKGAKLPAQMGKQL